MQWSYESLKGFNLDFIHFAINLFYILHIKKRYKIYDILSIKN